MMRLIGQQVEHRMFGTGKVTGQNKTLVTIEFEGMGEKRFLFPAAFEDYLNLTDADTHARMAKELLKIHQEEEAERQQVEEKARQEREAQLLEKKKPATRRKKQ